MQLIVYVFTNAGICLLFLVTIATREVQIHLICTCIFRPDLRFRFDPPLYFSYFVRGQIFAASFSKQNKKNTRARTIQRIQ